MVNDDDKTTEVSYSYYKKKDNNVICPPPQKNWKKRMEGLVNSIFTPQSTMNSPFFSHSLPYSR
jgi:hypothetical protein